MNIAIIPARKGSERMPNKNRSKINGSSIFKIALDQALRVKIFDRIIVTTNDEVLINESKNLPILIDRRPSNYSCKKTPLISVINYIISKFNIEDDANISLLTVTNPLREDIDILKPNKIFQESNRERRLLSVTEVDYPIEMTWKIGENGNLKSNFSIDTTRKQDFTKSYKWNDSIIIDKASGFSKNNQNLYGKDSIPYFMPHEKSIQIDSEWQFKLVKFLLENNLAQNF